MTPTNKSPEMENILHSVLGASRRETIIAGRCVPPPFGCGTDVGTFRDLASLAEYRISGLCQRCQDKIFGGE
jgi:hypothetical protein